MELQNSPLNTKGDVWKFNLALHGVTRVTFFAVPIRNEYFNSKSSYDYNCVMFDNPTCWEQIPLSKIDDVGLFAVPKPETSTIKMHIPSLVKIHSRSL